MSSLQTKIASLVSEFTSEVLKAIQSSSIHEVAGMMEAGPSVSSPVRVAKTAPAKKKVVATAKPNGKAASKPNGEAKSEGGGERRQRRTKDEMNKTRMSILSTLRDSKEPMKSSQIAEAIGESEAQALTFPLRTLVKENLISQKGVRGQAKYVIRTAGKEKVAEA